MLACSFEETGGNDLTQADYLKLVGILLKSVCWVASR